MRRRQQGQGTLFPFVSVLICIIGTLSLLIMATGIADSFEVGVDYVRAGDPIVDELRQARREQQAVRVKQAIYRDRLETANQELQSARNEGERLVAARGMLDDARAEVASRERRLNPLRKRREALDVRLREILRPSRTPSSGSAKVTIAGGSKYKPIFVECREDGCIVLANRRKIATNRIKASDYVGTLLSNIKKDPDWCLFLLVRRGGVHSFDRLHNRALGKVPLGFHPILTDLELDVSDWPQPSWL